MSLEDLLKDTEHVLVKFKEEWILVADTQDKVTLMAPINQADKLNLAHKGCFYDGESGLEVHHKKVSDLVLEDSKAFTAPVKSAPTKELE